MGLMLYILEGGQVYPLPPFFCSGSLLCYLCSCMNNHLLSGVTCSSPRRDVRSHSLVCSENSLLVVGIGQILNKELELIFPYDGSDRTCVYT